MSYPDFFDNFPILDLPFPRDVVTGRAVRSDDGLVVFFQFLQDFSLPEHSHKGQYGTVLSGSFDLTISGETRTIRPGDVYNIPPGAPHSAEIPAGTLIMDVFEEPDRYPLIR